MKSLAATLVRNEIVACVVAKSLLTQKKRFECPCKVQAQRVAKSLNVCKLDYALSSSYAATAKIRFVFECPCKRTGIRKCSARIAAGCKIIPLVMPLLA